MGPFWTFSGPFWTISDHFGTIPDHFGPFGPLREQLRAVGYNLEQISAVSDQYKKNWQGSRIVKYKNLRSFSWLRSISQKNLKYSFFRIDKFKNIHIYDEGGWHFSYLMSEVEMQNKIKAWTHSELDTKENSNLDTIKQRVKQKKDLFGRDITFSKVDFNEIIYPRYLVENKEVYKDWII